MFSVDNFYHFFESHYGFDKTGVSVMFPKDGAKDLDSFKHMIEQDLVLGHGSKTHTNSVYNLAILHDQEMFFALPTLITYRNQRRQAKNSTQYKQHLTLDETFFMYWATCSWPIWCHSEQNSPDIAWLEKLGVIPCYYFYHGLVARDWFRHWKHHGDLVGISRDWKYRFLLYARDHSGLREYRENVINNLSSHQQHIKYNWSGHNSVSSDYSAKISVEDAQDCAIHLVAETVFDQKKIHLTEKIFKPMVMRQPFVLFAPAGSLKYLRSYGFRTFSEVWDESYDHELDHGRRLTQITQLIKDLADMPGDEFRDKLDRCQEIIEHNHHHFFSEEFEKQMLNELHINMNRAIEAQRSKIKTDPGGSFFWALDRIQQRGQIATSGQDLIGHCLMWFQQNDPDRFRAIIDQYPWAKGLSRS